MLGLAVCGGVCYNGCVAVDGGEGITPHSYCDERPSSNPGGGKKFYVSSYPSRPAFGTHLGPFSTLGTAAPCRG